MKLFRPYSDKNKKNEVLLRCEGSPRALVAPISQQRPAKLEGQAGQSKSQDHFQKTRNLRINKASKDKPYPKKLMAEAFLAIAEEYAENVRLHRKFSYNKKRAY